MIRLIFRGYLAQNWTVEFLRCPLEEATEANPSMFPVTMLSADVLCNRTQVVLFIHIQIPYWSPKSTMKQEKTLLRSELN